jgi:hypothetical protein
MKKSQFSPNQIASILKEFDNGKTAEEITISLLKLGVWIL